MVLRMKNFNFWGDHWKIRLLREGGRGRGFTKNQYRGGNLLKGGGLGLFANLAFNGLILHALVSIFNNIILQLIL